MFKGKPNEPEFCVYVLQETAKLIEEKIVKNYDGILESNYQIEYYIIDKFIYNDEMDPLAEYKTEKTRKYQIKDFYKKCYELLWVHYQNHLTDENGYDFN